MEVEDMRSMVLMAFGAVLLLLFAAGCTANNAKPETASVSQLKTWIGPYCSGKTGADLGNCTYTHAVQTKDVAVCSTLDELEERNTCIAMWCGSATRDFNSCYRIADNDDQLLCLSKCNPNQVK